MNEVYAEPEFELYNASADVMQVSLGTEETDPRPIG